MITSINIGILFILFYFILVPSLGKIIFNGIEFQEKYEQKLAQEKYQEIILQITDEAKVYYSNNNYHDLFYSYLRIGYFNLYLGKKLEAEKNYQKAESLISNKRITNISYSLIMASYWCYYYSIYGNKIQATRYKGEILGILNSTSNELILSDAYSTIEMYYTMTAQIDSALYYSKKSLNLLMTSNASQLTIALQEYSLANLQFRSGKIEKCINTCLKALKKFNSINAVLGVSTCYQLLAISNSTTQNYDAAILYLKQIEQMEIKYNYALANALRILAGIYLKTNELELAKYYFNKSIHLFKQNQAEGDIHNKHILYAYEGLGSTYQASTNYDSAEYFLQKAFEIRKLMYGENNPDLAYSYLLLAKLYSNTSKNRSITYLNRLLEQFTPLYGKVHRQIFKAHQQLAETYQDTLLTLALDHAQKAIQSIEHGFDRASWYANPILKKVSFPAHLLQALETKARLLAKYYHEYSQDKKDIEFSLSTYQLAMALADSIRFGFRSEGSQLELAKTTAAIYRGALQNANHLYELTQDIKYLYLAFEISEKNKAMVLLSGMQGEQAKAMLPQEVIEQEQDLKAELNYFTTQIEKLEQKSEQTTEDQRTLQRYKNKEFELKEDLEQFFVKLEQEYPDYYNFKYKIPISHVNDIQSQLKNNQKLISFFEGYSSWFIFLISPTEFLVKKTPKSMEEELLIQQLRASISSSAFTFSQNESWKNYTQSAFALYKNWMSPIEEYLSKDDELIIIPYGKMALIPFEVLLSKQAVSMKKDHYKNLAYLIKDYQLSYAQSATIWHQAGNQNYEANLKSVVAFAPSFDQNEPSSNFDQKILEDTVRGGLNPLRWTKKELELIGKYFVGNFFIDQEATEANFKTVASQADIIHIASHAVAQDQRPLFSRIYFTQTADTINDAALHTFELYNLNLKAKLAVLSACNTGYGKTIQGEGVLNLARGFTYAGCPSVVMSLWNANDRSSAEIMSSFYKHLSIGKNKSVALRQAKLDYLKQADVIKSHPYLWAQFVATGDMRPVVEKSYWQWVVGTVVFLILISFVILKLRKK